MSKNSPFSTIFPPFFSFFFLLIAVQAQFDSAFDQLNIAGGDSSNAVEIPSYDPELVEAYDASGDVD